MFTAQTLFPDALDFGEGTNAKLLDAIPPSRTNTAAGFGTNATRRYIQLRAGETPTTSGTPTPGQDHGWNVLKSDMNNTSGTPNRRHIAAGTWTFHCVLNPFGADTSSNFSIKVYVHRRNSDGTLTELFNAESALASLAAVSNVTWTKTSVAEIFFSLDETLQIEYWLQGRGGGTTGLVSQTITWNIGPTILLQACDVLMPSGISTEFSRSFSKVARGLVTIQKRTSQVFAKTARGIVAIHKQINKPLLKTARGIVTLHKFTTKSFSKTARGIVTLQKKTSKAFTQTARGIATLQKQTNKAFSKTARGIASFTRILSAYRSFTVTARGIVTLRKMTSKFFTKTARGIVSGFLGRPFGEIPPPGSGSGGGETSSTFIK